MAVVIAFAGGRTGMISAATGAMATVGYGNLVKEHGLQYLLVATILTGIIQIVLAYLGVAKPWVLLHELLLLICKCISYFLIFMAQLPELVSVTWHVYALTIIGLGIIYLYLMFQNWEIITFSSLLQLFYLQFCLFCRMGMRNVGDMGELPDTLPIFLWTWCSYEFWNIKYYFSILFGFSNRWSFRIIYDSYNYWWFNGYKK